MYKLLLIKAKKMGWLVVPTAKKLGAKRVNESKKGLGFGRQKNYTKHTFLTGEGFVPTPFQTRT